ncbi:MAG: lipid-A-disaccharide synthase [Bacteroidetes bacterium]|nr:lipid-A-disaccharide synthase [Bacteroidota bacterium]MBU2505747.1 lipid-A-disaccharide synthase [Bacteroidota bacterium]
MNKIMIIAGEASGDLHGAALIAALKNIKPQLLFYGVGGDNMINEGLMPQFHIRDLAFLGFAEVIKHLPFIRKAQKKLLAIIQKEDIPTLVLIDYPGFNLNFAKRARRLGVNIVYYISPQIWAWGRGRVKKIQERVDKMLVVFPFEKDFYESFGVDVTYVGHPLVEIIENYKSIDKDELVKMYSLDSEKGFLLLMPGSRKHEIEKIFPAALDAAKRLAQKFNLQIVVPCAQNIDESIFSNHADGKNFTVVRNNVYDFMKYSKFGMIKSGTSTLEAAIFGLPFVVIYKTTDLTYRIGKFLVKIKHLAMPNIIADRYIVKEFIQDELRSDKIFNYCADLLGNEVELNKMKKELSLIKAALGTTGASKKAAEEIVVFSNEG